MPKRLANLVDPEDAIDDRMQRGLRDGLIHLLKHCARANVDALYTKLFMKNRRQRHRLRSYRARQNADLRNHSSNAGRAQRLAEGSRSSNLNDPVCALSASGLSNPLRPLRAFLVVASRIESKAMGASQFLIARRRSDNLCSQQLAKLQSKDGHAACSLNSNGF